MSRISTEQIIEILDEVDEIRISKIAEGVYAIQTIDFADLGGADQIDIERGGDFGELVNELHTRL